MSQVEKDLILAVQQYQRLTEVVLQRFTQVRGDGSGMSWVGRKLAMSDDVDQKQVINEYFELKEKQREEELKKFWEEYEQEYFNGQVYTVHYQSVSQFTGVNHIWGSHIRNMEGHLVVAVNLTSRIILV